MYAYAIAILVATFVQLLMAFGALGRIDFRLQMTIDWHDPRIRRVFTLMLPVTIGLGIVNLDQLINSVFGTLVSDEAPRAIDNAFRIYMLPQGLFSVAVATVLFPTLSRMASRREVGSMRKAIGVRDAPDQSPADSRVGVHHRALDPNRKTGLSTRRVQHPLHRTRIDRAVLVCLQPPLRGVEPALDACRSSRCRDRGSRPAWRRSTWRWTSSSASASTSRLGSRG